MAIKQTSVHRCTPYSFFPYMIYLPLSMDRCLETMKSTWISQSNIIKLLYEIKLLCTQPKSLHFSLFLQSTYKINILFCDIVLVCENYVLYFIMVHPLNLNNKPLHIPDLILNYTFKKKKNFMSYFPYNRQIGNKYFILWHCTDT
jgi:hypothetical protein